MNITFDKFIGEKEDVIEKIINSKGLILCSGPTGGGKTFTYIKKFKELAKIDKNRVFIILCPNRLQNQQNGKLYNIDVIIGGIKADEHIRVASAVYEKIDEIMFAYSNKKITLIVDEAHELIESIDYREKALNNIDVASQKAFNTIHVTATPRKLLKYYKYNKIYNFVLKKRKNNLEKLKIIAATDVDVTLFKLLEINKQNNKKSLVFLSGSTDDLKSLKNNLDKKGYSVEKITREDKESDLYFNIIQNSLISSKYDIILSTKVIECGTNINNTDIVPIEIIKNENHFNPDSTEQKFARLRNKNQEGYFIFKKQEEIKEIRSYESIKENYKYSLDILLSSLDQLKKIQNSIFNIDYAIDKALESDKNALAGSITELINFEKVGNTYKFEINEKKFINKVIREYDKQLLHNINKLKNELTGRIKSDCIEVIDDFDVNNKDTLKYELKEDKRNTKLKKAEQNKQAKSLILEMLENNNTTFKEYLSSKDKYEIKSIIKQCDINTYNNIIFLEKEKTELSKFEKLYNLECDTTETLNCYKECNSAADVDRVLKHYNYKLFNDILVTDIPKLYSSYAILRNKFDPVKNKQGRITQKDVLNVVGELNDKKMLWQFDSQRIKHDYEAALTETDTKKRKKLIKRIYDKTIKELKLIYILVDDGKGNYRISSLK